MELVALKPFIPSGPDFGLAMEFFRDLGFTVLWEVEGLAELTCGKGAFLLQNFHNQEMQENLMMMVAVDDLDAWWSRIEPVAARYGVRVAEPKDYPWGQREIHLIDPAGVCWHFAGA